MKAVFGNDLDAAENQDDRLVDDETDEGDGGAGRKRRGLAYIGRGGGRGRSGGKNERSGRRDHQHVYPQYRHPQQQVPPERLDRAERHQRQLREPLPGQHRDPAQGRHQAEAGRPDGHLAAVQRLHDGAQERAAVQQEADGVLARGRGLGGGERTEEEGLKEGGAEEQEGEEEVQEQEEVQAGTE